MSETRKPALDETPSKSFRLSDAVRAEGYGFFLSEAPRREDGALGKPEDYPGGACVVVRDGEFSIACFSDTWDHAYSAAHEIAEHRNGFKHSANMYWEQCNLLSRWHRLRPSGPTLQLTERTEFIRRVAIEVAMVLYEGQPQLSARSIGETAWVVASEVWDAKPEDC